MLTLGDRAGQLALHQAHPPAEQSQLLCILPTSDFCVYVVSCHADIHTAWFILVKFSVLVASLLTRFQVSSSQPCTFPDLFARRSSSLFPQAISLLFCLCILIIIQLLNRSILKLCYIINFFSDVLSGLSYWWFCSKNSHF